MKEIAAIIQQQIDLREAERVAPFECRHGLGCFCEQCAARKRTSQILDSMRKRRAQKKIQENQCDFPAENEHENIEEIQTRPTGMSLREYSLEGLPEGFRYGASDDVSRALDLVARLSDENRTRFFNSLRRIYGEL